jgi:hypothetical protein
MALKKVPILLLLVFVAKIYGGGSGGGGESGGGESDDGYGGMDYGGGGGAYNNPCPSCHDRHPASSYIFQLKNKDLLKIWSSILTSLNVKGRYLKFKQK